MIGDGMMWVPLTRWRIRLERVKSLILEKAGVPVGEHDPSDGVSVPFSQCRIDRRRPGRRLVYCRKWLADREGLL